MTMDERQRQLTDWVRQFDGLQDARPVPASVDASFRRYFRVGESETFIVMDAPPPQEDVRPFSTIAGYLRDMGLNAPDVYASDPERGFLLMSDLGKRQYLAALESDPAAADDLYNDAIDALLRMQAGGRAVQQKLPAYDAALLQSEMSLFGDWLCEKHLGISLDSRERQQWQDVCELLANNALSQPAVFVHRDYHSRNLMVVPGDNPGILDFQDAVEGPYTYDLVSLLKDCYIKWPVSEVRRRAQRFLDGLDSPLAQSPQEFVRHFDLTGVQRHLKAAGIFARLMLRDGKSGYLKDVPRTLSYVTDLADDYPEISFLTALIVDRVLPALEAKA